jgi:uncharacterized protein
MTKPANRRTLQRTIVSHLVRNGARRIFVFGSYARKDAKPKSDIDLVVRFTPGKSLLELVRIERELSEATGRRIDLLTEGGIDPGFMAAIKGEMEVLYG